MNEVDQGYRFLFISANRYTNPYPVYPLGISYLLSYLAERLPQVRFRVFDFNSGSEDALETLVTEWKPNFIGLSMRNVDDVNFYHQESFVGGYISIMDLIRKSSDALVIAGGSAFSIFPEEIFRLLRPDFGIRGEGEASLLRLLTSMISGTADLNTEGLVYERDGSVHCNDRHNFLHNPDLNFESDLIPFYWEKSGMINIQTKRGCPHRCIYCTYPLIEGSRVRTLDVDKVIFTLRNLYNNHGISYVFFTDSVFNIHEKYNIELANQLIKLNLPIRWGAYFSPHGLSKEHFELLARAGLTHIEFGTESLSDATLKNYGKHFRVDDVIRTSEYCDQAGIYFCHFMIIGGYGETESTVNESFENSRRINNTVFFPFIGMRIYPGTRLHQLAIEDGTVDSDDDLLTPVYYIADNIDYSKLKERAEMTGRRWVFPDEDMAPLMNRIRARKRKGSLWHHLKK